MTQDELTLVLDALKFCHGGEPCGTGEAIVVVEKALAQEQEPDYKLLFDELTEKFALLSDEAEMWKKQALFRFDATATQPQPKQEPVALQYPQKDIDWQREQQIKAQASTPPQRTWVSLTDEEIDKTLRVYEQDYNWTSFAKAIEAKLKEKNT